MRCDPAEERAEEEELHGPGYNLRPRSRSANADDAALKNKYKVLTVIHAPEILQTSTYRTRTEMRVTRREDASPKETRQDGGSSQSGPGNEDLAEEIIQEWEEFCRTPSKKTNQEIQESPDSPEGPLSGICVQPIKMKRISGYTTNEEIEDLLKEQENWELTESSPVVTDYDPEIRTLPSYLKQLRRILLRLREAATDARQNLDQIRRLAYDGDIVENGIQQLVGEQEMDTEDDE
ncbi:hypothetical protein DAPPUDRAFT_116855 [Daphnia pulex]|uniref:Uncharacterized protein n=1 Tax=Daphnia pulex TaxID=6669 RepID=E9HQR8_DAPPU|nr:hypothetical protein DAPPUDRAFT_116855 [Daphnia pulex]|eukprot:EFX65903.1 hypothetical protein DAPPUDRAFT_116855 [Daphnia pulex]